MQMAHFSPKTKQTSQDAPITLDGLQVLLSRETAQDPPQASDLEWGGGGRWLDGGGWAGGLNWDRSAQGLKAVWVGLAGLG